MKCVNPTEDTSHGRARIVIAAAVAIAGVLAAVLFLAAGQLDAQAPEPSTFTVSSPTVVGGDQVEVSIGFSPGSEPVGAMSGSLAYDTNLMAAVSCAPGLGSGSCNANVPGEVRFALISTNGFDEGELVGISFVDLGGALEAPLELTLRGLYDFNGLPVAPPVIEIDAPTGPEVLRGDLTGEVSSVFSGEGLYDLPVCAQLVSGDPGVEVEARCTLTNGLGNFSIAGLPVGDYAVTVTDDVGPYVSALQEVSITADTVAFAIFELDESTEPEPPVDQPTEPESPVVEQPVEEPPAETPPVSAPLSPPTIDPVYGGQVTGTVTNSATNGPVFGVVVCATMPVVGTNECDITTISGEYQIDALPTGNYVLSASDPVQRFTADTEGVFVGVFEGTSVSGVDLTVSPR